MQRDATSSGQTDLNPLIHANYTHHRKKCHAIPKNASNATSTFLLLSLRIIHNAQCTLFLTFSFNPDFGLASPPLPILELAGALTE